jgi:phytoene dehydrogenase-like protein
MRRRARLSGGVGARWDAVVVGAGPNGLAAAIELARAGRSVLVLEAAEAPGGGTRSDQRTLPGFIHDLCSAVHPLAAASPFFRSLPLEALGLRWLQPEIPLAHPLDGGRAALLARSIQGTAEDLGPDGPRWRLLLGPLVERAGAVIDEVLGEPGVLPRRPVALARFGAPGLLPVTALARAFRGDGARALLGGLAAHAIRPLTRPLTGAVGLLFGLLGHAVGWPVAEGGSGRIADALVAHLRELGGELEVGRPVRTMADVPPARAVLLDLTPRQVARVAADRLPPEHRRALEGFRYGPGVFKVDWALDGPIPWAAEPCRRAGTLHLGGTLDEVAAAEAAVWRGEHPARPFVLLSQPTVVDPTRAPEGKHVAWAYCHVPNGSTLDMVERIEAQVERFAPGFRDLVVARATMGPADLERLNENHVGGDIAGGAGLLGLALARLVPGRDPYPTPDPGIFVCSSSTPPGAGVHGMCGVHAARSALRRALA